MKPLTKTVVSRGGGIAAQFVPADQEPKGTWEEPKVWVANPVANVANKPRYTRWREKNPELYKERQAGYMRKMRAKPQNP